MIICQKCGTQNEDDSIFCNSCGWRLEKTFDDNNDEPNKPVYSVHPGAGDYLFVYEDKIVIKHTGMLNKIWYGRNKSINYSEIETVKFKKADTESYGYIYFKLKGKEESSFLPTDEYSVTFYTEMGSKMLEIYEFVNNKLNKPRIVTKEKKQSQDFVEELKKYKELLDLEIISQDEFNLKKKQLLGI